jgi:hypothetical protein
MKITRKRQHGMFIADRRECMKIKEVPPFRVWTVLTGAEKRLRFRDGDAIVVRASLLRHDSYGFRDIKGQIEPAKWGRGLLAPPHKQTSGRT